METPANGTTARLSGSISGMAIDFIQLLGDQGWVPYTIDPGDPTHVWSDGTSLAEAPVDVEATFGGAMWRSTRIDSSFTLFGYRCRAGFCVPRRHHDARMLFIVIGGELIVEDCTLGAEQEIRSIGPGQFWVSDAGTAFEMTAGADGATFVESRPLLGGAVVTSWHDSRWVRRR